MNKINECIKKLNDCIIEETKGENDSVKIQALNVLLNRKSNEKLLKMMEKLEKDLFTDSE
jgi:hypothetical protein